MARLKRFGAAWLGEMRSRAEADSEFWSAMIGLARGVLLGGVLFDDWLSAACRFESDVPAVYL